MDAFTNSFNQDANNFATSAGAQGDVIIEQEEETIDADGNIELKQRTLRNPTPEELDEKTLDELKTDEGDDVTTVKTFKLKLSDNDASDHAFSSFGLDEPKSVDKPSLDTTPQMGVVRSFFWFTFKMLTVLLVGFGIFTGYKSYLRKTVKKRRYNGTDLGSNESDSDEDDEEELRNIRNAVKRGGSNHNNLLKEDELDD